MAEWNPAADSLRPTWSSDGRPFAHLRAGRRFRARRGDEGGAHRVCRVAAIEPERCGELSHHAVDGVRVHRAMFLLALAVGTQRAEQRAVEVGAVAGETCPMIG